MSVAKLPAPPLRWGVQRRLEFIDFRLFWYGRFTRKGLTDTFGISAQQASADIQQYREWAGENLVYDPAQRIYLRAPTFSPKFMNDAAERYLLQAAAVKNDWMTKDNTWFEEMPLIEYVELRSKKTNSTILLRVLDAIRDNQQVKVKYASLTGSPVSVRTLAPHAMFYSMSKWYARCWSHEHNDFRDYNLNRIERIEAPVPCAVDRSLDYEWAQRINLKIIPNSRLPPEKRTAVAAEYSMTDGHLSVPCRLSMTFYLMNQYNLDMDHGVLIPEKQQLILENREDVVAARGMARQLSKEALARGGA
jgi:WYL domain